MKTEDILKKLNQDTLLLIYFSFPECGVCKSLLPKVKKLLSHYPDINFQYVDIHEHTGFSGQHLIFAVPTIVLFQNGKEIHRFSRHIPLSDIDHVLNRCMKFHSNSK